MSTNDRIGAFEFDASTTIIISPRQRHHHHSCHPSPHHSFIPISKLFFFSNPILHRHLAIRTHSRFLCLLLLFSVFFLIFSLYYYSLSLTFFSFSLLFLFSLLQSFFSNFGSFTFNSISILSISHFIFF